MAGVVAALVADHHRGLLGQEVGRLALALVAPLQPDDHGGRHQRHPDPVAEERDVLRPMKKAPTDWSGTRIDLSRIAPPTPRWNAVRRSPDRLTGRPMRPSRAI